MKDLKIYKGGVEVKIREISKNHAIEKYGKENVPEIGLETMTYGKVIGYAIRSDLSKLFILCEKKPLEDGGMGARRVFANAK